MTEKIKFTEDSKAHFTLTATESEWQNTWEATVEEAGRYVEVPGFRKGHAPVTVVVEKLGKGHLQEEALNRLVKKRYADFIKTHDLQTIAPPEIKVKQVEPAPIVEITVSVLPEINLENLKKIKVKPIKETVKKEQIEEAIESLKKRFTEYKDVSRPAKLEDRIEVSFTGHTADGTKLDKASSKNHPAILGQQNLIPDFEKNLLGLSAGQEKEFKVTFPADYHDPQVASQTLTFKAKLEKVQSPQKITEKSIAEKILPKDPTPTNLRKKITQDLEKEAKRQSEIKTREKVFDEILKKTELTPPAELVSREVEELKREQDSQLRQSGITLERYLQQIKSTPTQNDKKIQETATRNVKLRLILDKLRKDRDIKITEKQQAEIAAESQHLPEKDRSSYKLYRENNLILNQIITPFIE